MDLVGLERRLLRFQGPHRWGRRAIRTRRHRIATDVLLRSVAKHLVGFLPTAAQCRSVVHLLPALIGISDEPGLLPARFSGRAGLVLILPCSHGLTLPCLCALFS